MNPDAAPPPLTPLQAALARIEASRRVLRAEILPPCETPAGTAGSGPSWRLTWRSWRRQLRRWPLADMAAQAAQSWWSRHPWRPIGELVAGELADGITPLVKRRPLTCVAAAACLGVLVMATRPWRWRMISQQLHPLGRALLQPLGSLPVQAAIASWVISMLRDNRPSSDETTAPSPSTSASQQAGAAAP